MAVLVSEVWPDPDPVVMDRLRRLGLGDYQSWCSLEYRSWVEIRDDLTVVADYHDHLLVEGGRGFGFWPPLPDVDPVWKAASMLTALRSAEQEEPLLPVAYKVMWDAGVVDASGREWTWPRRLMGPATCATSIRRCPNPPMPSCACGFHAAYLVSELAAEYRCAPAVLVVTPAGKTVWHENAWRSQYYQTHAAVVPLDWEIPDDWDEIPVVRARAPLIPYRAYQVAREVRAMIALDEVPEELEKGGR